VLFVIASGMGLAMVLAVLIGDRRAKRREEAGPR